MLLSFDKKDDLLRFLAKDQSRTSYLLMCGFQRLKSWTAIPLKPLTFLYGPNSAGKGAVLDAHSLIRMFWSNDKIRELSDAIRRWGRKEDGVVLCVGLSEMLSLHQIYDDSYFDQYVPTSNYPGFIHEFQSKKLRRDPQRLTWFASWGDAPSSAGVPNMELYLGDQQAAALVHSDPPEAELRLQRDVLESVLGGSLLEFELFAFLKDRAERDNANALTVTIDCLLDFELAKLPTFFSHSLSTNGSNRDLEALLVVLFSSLPSAGLSPSCYIGPIRRVLSVDELKFHASGDKYRRPSSVTTNFNSAAVTGDGCATWAQLAIEVAQDTLAAVFPNSNRKQGGRHLLDEVNRWLDSPQCFDSGYRVTASTEFVIPSDLLTKRGNLKRRDVAECGNIGVEVSLGLIDRLGREHTLQDVGTGFSQVIPVIIGAFQERYGSLAFFEQPELHLHPRLQTILCDLFIDAFNQSGKGTYGAGNVVIESHSEHLMLRLLRRIRETSKADIQHMRFSISADDVAVLYFEPDGDETFVHHLRISPDGTFADRWPRGFFDERFKEIFNE